MSRFLIDCMNTQICDHGVVLAHYCPDCGKTDCNPDMIGHPPHYANHRLECIDAIEAALTPEEYRGYLRGNRMKYLWRMDHKGDPDENQAKADWYLLRLQYAVE